MSFISIQRVSVSFYNNIALDKVSFDIEKGEIACVIGPNGSGKTTLIRAILGLDPHKGNILFNGEPVKKHLDKIGYIPQKFDFDKTFPITVKEFLDLANSAYKQNIKKEICREIQIQNIMHKKLGDLSGGQFQRVLMAQAIAKQPQLLILDEPTTGVDMEGIKNFYEIVRHFNKNHQATIILVSHEVSMVYNLATTVICLNKKVICHGKPKEVINESMLNELYGSHLTPHIHHH